MKTRHRKTRRVRRKHKRGRGFASEIADVAVKSIASSLRANVAGYMLKNIFGQKVVYH